MTALTKSLFKKAVLKSGLFLYIGADIYTDPLILSVYEVLLARSKCIEGPIKYHRKK